MSLYQKWARHEYSERRRLVFLGFLAPLFLALIPWGIVKGSAALDRRFRLPLLVFGLANPILGIVLLAGGMALAQWAIWTEFNLGRGTPVPIMPTQELVVRGPYAYSRNPMTLGTIMAYGGIAVWIGSVSALGLVLGFLALLVLYNKFLEERELTARFGSAYVEYKKRTPFLVPRIRRVG